MSYKLIMFDLGGTLIDTNYVQLLALQRLISERAGRAYEIRELEFTLGLSAIKTLPMFGLTDIENENYLWNTYIKELNSQVRLFPQIDSVIKRIKENGKKMGIVTSASKEEVGDYFAPTGMDKYFDCIVCADDTELHKPHPEPILKALEIIGVNNDEALFVGDSIHDFQCALNSCVDFGMALWSRNDFIRNGAIGYKFYKPTEVIDVLNN